MQNSGARGFFFITWGMLVMTGCDAAPSADDAPAAKVEAGSPAQPAGTAQPAGNLQPSEIDAFFVDWFKGHGHKDVVVDKQGVGVAGNPARWHGSLYDSKPHGNGGFIVEVEFTMRLPSAQKITEFVAGLGKTEKEAINYALANFTLTTSHVVYKAFINPVDPHMTAKPLTINGAHREVIEGDLFMIGNGPNKDVDMKPISAEILGAIKDAPLTPGPHWIKVVYGQQDGKPMTVAVTLDNADAPQLTAAVKQLNWPQRKEFYMAKEFMVVK